MISATDHQGDHALEIESSGLITLPAADTAAIETTLNEYGADRWDCFWIDRQDSNLVLYLKKPRRSYLKAVPAKELLKLVPLLDGGDGGK